MDMSSSSEVAKTEHSFDFTLFCSLWIVSKVGSPLIGVMADVLNWFS